MKSLKNYILEGNDINNSSILKGYVKPEEFVLPKNCEFTQEQFNELVKLNKNNPVKCTSKGSLYFNWSNMSKRKLVFKFSNTNNEYAIRKCIESTSPFLPNEMRDQIIGYDKKSHNYKIKTFDEMIDLFKSYIEKNEKNIL